MLLKVRVGALVAAFTIAAYAACSHDDASQSTDSGSGGPSRPDGSTADSGGLLDSAIPRGDGGVFPNPFFGGTWKSGVQSLSDCNVQMSVDPASTPGPLTWVPCPSGRTGCQTMVANWSTNPGAKLYVNRPEPVRLVNGSPYLTYTRQYPQGGAFNALMQVIQPLRGNPVLAVGEIYEGDASDFCIASATLGDFGFAYASSGASAPFELDWATWSAPTSFSFHLFNGTDVPAASEYAIGKTDIALGPAALMDFAAQTIHKVSGLPSGGALDLPTMVPAGAYVVEQVGAGNLIALLGTDASLTSIVDPTASARSVTWLTVDRASSNAIVWVESDSSDLSSNPIIWTSPYSTTAGGVTRTKVAAFQDASARGGADGVSNAGVTLNLTGDTTALLTRLSDGMGWAINAEPGMYFVQPLWADDTEIWIEASSYGPHDANEILRLQRSSLGAPTVSRGF